MTLRRPLPPFPLWAILILLVIAVLIVLSTQGCATCEPTIIKEPVVVEVPVPIPPEPLEIPPMPEPEACDGTVQERVKCVRRNIEWLKIYVKSLLDEMEAHNAAIIE